MSVFSDRRSLRQIGGFRAYLRQVAWSLWWRFEGADPPRSRRRTDPASSKTGPAARDRTAAAQRWAKAPPRSN